MQPWFTRLLSLQLVETAELDPSQNYLTGFHPYGVLATGAFTNLCTEGIGFSSVSPGICSHLMMLHWSFWVLVFRDYIMSVGESCHSFYPRKMRVAGMKKGFKEGGQLFSTSSK